LPRDHGVVRVQQTDQWRRRLEQEQAADRAQTGEPPGRTFTDTAGRRSLRTLANVQTQ
jgi:transposase-like protein